jgi:hypothetical protein
LLEAIDVIQKASPLVIFYLKIWYLDFVHVIILRSCWFSFFLFNPEQGHWLCMTDGGAFTFHWCGFSDWRAIFTGYSGNCVLNFNKFWFQGYTLVLALHFK